ncbi:hypothetical protein BKA64DRAFT_750940 [Cadophora sp. MPI-SDFR-AT-0126]|nr:hypothetical protein BKA64DRAFT_750940 [Leotiomycetes sp. MPI-SDFR-AT-0126]
MLRHKKLLSQLAPLQIPAPTALVKFDHFPLLPLELQTMIWKETARHPRIIKIFETKGLSAPSNSVIEGQIVNPGIMGACKGSRKEGSKVYELCTTRVLDPYTRKPVNIYINFSADTFLLDSPSWPINPRNVTWSMVPGIYTPVDWYNWDIKCIKQIERLIQLFPGNSTLSMPLNLLEAARITEYQVCIDFSIKEEKYTLEDGVHEDLSLREFGKVFKEIFVATIKEEEVDLKNLDSLKYELIFHGDSFGCDLVPAPQTAED